MQLLCLYADKIKAKYVGELKNTPTENSREEIWSIFHDRSATGNDVDRCQGIIETGKELRQHCILLRTYLDNIIVPVLKEKWQMFSELSVDESRALRSSSLEGQRPQRVMDYAAQLLECNMDNFTGSLR